MIVMVTSKGAGYTAADGLNITVPQLEKIHSGSGKMTAIQVNSSCGFWPTITGVSGNIATMMLVSSGMVDDGSGVTDFDNVEFTLIADGY